MTSPGAADSSHSQDAAFEVLKGAAAERDIYGDYRTIAAAFNDEDYRHLVTLAWRYQFSDDRYQFKRELREMQQYVCDKVNLPTEGDEA